MGELGVSALVVVCLGVAVAILSSRRGALGDDGPRGVLLRHMAVAAISAVLCAVMYLADYRGASALTLAVANGAMVFAPAMIWVAERRVNGHPGAAALGVALAAALVTALFGGLTPALLSGAVKVAALLVVCVLATIETFRMPVAALPGSRLIRGVTLGYAAFCAARLLLGLVGFASAFLPWGVITQLTTVLGILAVLLVGVGAWRMAAHLGGSRGADASDAGALRAWTAGALADGIPVVVVTLSLPDLPLIRAAHGATRADSIRAALLQAVRDTAPADSATLTRRDIVTVGLRASDATAERANALHRRFDELTPLVAYEDLPEISIAQQPVTDLGALDALVARRRAARP